MSEIVSFENPESAQDQESSLGLADSPPPVSGPPEPRGPWQPRWPFDWHPGRKARIALIVAGAMSTVAFGVFIGFYIKFARLTDERLRAGVFAETLNIFGAPHTVAAGDRISKAGMIAWLRESGYGTAANPVGRYEVRPNAILVLPNADSEQESVEIDFSGDHVERIVSAADRSERREYAFLPRLITNVSDNREQRRLVQFSEIPPALVDAVVSAEDKHFFSHGGFDLLRIMKAAYVDLKQGRKEQGASTLSMQLARGIWLEPQKRWKRKLAELMLTMHLEHKLSKQEIFTYYANQVYLGRRGTFSINGFGEAARAYFDKNLSQLNVPEAALLAGLVQRPSYYNPFRYPERAIERRNLVLRLMHENRRLSAQQYAGAIAAPLGVSPGGLDNNNSQFFLDLANEEFQRRLGDREPGGESVYTTLDDDLQNAAMEAVRIGMANVDAQLRHGKQGASLPPGQPQVALIALDPHTGEIKALVGGRDYGASQLNHATAERQPGSSFKPFVYAAALNTAVVGGSRVFTPASTEEDQPTTFQFGGIQYRPGNFGQDFMGTVSLREALAHSLNVATVSLAEQVGYTTVVDMARRAGLNSGIKATPAMALGSYVCTPFEIAGAYTVFANGGMYVKPAMLAGVRAQDGTVIYQHSPETRTALDPRVNYLMVNMLEEVLRTGTGAGARSRGFYAPAAGKTGTSRDGWFAGFTSRLLCVVWVGFDDYRELGLEGAKSALPIWTEFMKRALNYSAYRDAREFPPPSGVTSARLCSESKQLATPECPDAYTEFFVSGHQPATECPFHSATRESRSDPDAAATTPALLTAPSSKHP